MRLDYQKLLKSPSPSKLTGWIRLYEARYRIQRKRFLVGSKSFPIRRTWLSQPRFRRLVIAMRSYEPVT